MCTRVFVLLLTFAPPVLASRLVSVAQLEQLTAELRDKPDGDTARRLSDLRLAERLSSRRLAILEGAVRGEQSRSALLALADQSAFLDPPASDIPSDPSPDIAAQRQMMGLVVGYVTRAIPKLPDFLATRTMTRFADQPLRSESLANEGHFTDRYQPLRPVGNAVQHVSYQGGREEVGQTADTGERGLRTWGEFGPILSTILLDAAHSKLEWLHWETGESGRLAVFKYVVPKEKSHFEINYCCVADSEGRPREFRELVGYSGEMAADPETGTIGRLDLVADLKPAEPVVSAGLVVEYGNVEIGGKTYVCPTHSISLSRGQSLTKVKQEIVQTGFSQQNYGLSAVAVGATPEVVNQTLLNDSVYTQYHVFGSEMRMIAGTPASVPTRDGSTELPAASPSISDATSNSAVPASETLAQPEPKPVANTEGASASPGPLESARSETPPIPEISASETRGLPDLPVNQQPSGFTLRTTSRLVDVSVVAFDKKGNPVTDLKPGDLEIYDNGRKQEIRFFSQAERELPTVAAGADQTAQAQSPPELPAFSNRPSPDATAHNILERRQTSIIFLIDASHVAFGDLTYARAEMLRFLKTVPVDERVGLYVLNRSRFQILLEPTLDHARVASTLTAWMPSAQDLARAQDEEQRNRRQLDWVHRVDDLAYVNGNGEGGTDPEMNSSGTGGSYAPPPPPPDATLRSMGNSPERDALYLLQLVGRHLAAIPGHKALVWVSSDNVLADWRSQALKQDQGSKTLDPLAMHARELLNEAHASIYPLDVSQLEAGGVGAELRERNVSAVGYTSRSPETASLGDAAPGMKPGRETAKMQQDTHPIQPAFRELAEATGGRALRRAGDIAAELDSIMTDGRAAYMLTFTPDAPPDDIYHHIAVKLATRRDIAVRSRTGYFYSKEPATLKDRFQGAVWQPTDVTEIGLNGTLQLGPKTMLRLNIAATDLGLVEQGGSWTDKVDIFLIQRDDAALNAKLVGKTLALRLKSGTYERTLKDGINVDDTIEKLPENGALRAVVVDENTGRIGTLTIAASEMVKQR